MLFWVLISEPTFLSFYGSTVLASCLRADLWPSALKTAQRRLYTDCRCASERREHIYCRESTREGRWCVKPFYYQPTSSQHPSLGLIVSMTDYVCNVKKISVLGHDFQARLREKGPGMGPEGVLSQPFWLRYTCNGQKPVI